MSPPDLPTRLDHICDLIQHGLEALTGAVGPRSQVGRTALRLAKSEVATLKDEVLLAEALRAYRVPDTSGKKPRVRKTAAPRGK